MERKKRRDLSYECPIVQIACCKCAKDKYIVLKETVMPRLESDIAKVQASCAIVLYNGTDIKGPRKVYLVPKGINANTVTFLDGGLGDGGGGGIQFHVTGQSDPVTIPFLGRSPITRVKRWNLQVKKIVSNFYNFYIGTIAFLATILGMEGSKAYYCLLCAAGAILGFNCEWAVCVAKKRMTENMEVALLQYLQKSATSCSIRNINRVNNKRMLPLDVAKVLVPILHCPMGLVDKLLESFTDYVWKEVLLLPPKDDSIWKHMQEINQQLASSKILLQSKRESSKSKKDAYNELKTPANEEEHKRAQEEESKAQAEKTKLCKKEQRQRKHLTK